MTVTESQAYNKWCPHVRCAVKNDGETTSGNCEYGDRLPLDYASCIGSSCMMWKWADAGTSDDMRTGRCGLSKG